MTILEIIHLRSAGAFSEVLRNQILESLETDETGADLVIFYQRKGLDTDFAVHIQRSGIGTSGPTGLGLQLASSLRSYGLVEHTIWEELDGFDPVTREDLS